MLKKPSGLRVPSAGAARPSGDGDPMVTMMKMEVESTQVQTLPDGKKMVDVTMRRHSQHTDKKETEKLVMPQFDDDESSSSSEDEDEPGSPAAKCEAQGYPSQENDTEHPHPEAHAVVVAGPFQGDSFQWSGVQDIQTLTHANMELHHQVGDLKGQLKTLQIQLEALAPVPGMNASDIQDILLDKGGSDHDIRDAKIVHQAKSLRHLKRAFQRDKQLTVDAVKKCKALEMEKSHLEKENETLTLKLARFQARASAAGPGPGSSASGPVTTEQGQSASEKARDLPFRKKYDDLRIKHDKLASDLKKTQRALVKEVGEDVSLEDLIEGTSSSSSSTNPGLLDKRGRAQQIIMLKAKVKKLDHELMLAKATSGGGSGAAGQVAGLAQDVDQRAQQDISGQHAQRQKQIDKLTLEKEELHEKLHQLTKRYDGLKSRSQTLEKEKQESKGKLQVLVDKSRNDDQLVDALQKQLELWRGKMDENGAKQRARTAEGFGSCSTLPKDERMELERLRSIVNEYKRLPQQQQQQLQQQQPVGMAMPMASEAAQYRTVAIEKERLSELVKSLQSQLDDKEKQIKSLSLVHQSSSSCGNSSNSEAAASRIPRFLPGAKATTLASSQYYPTPPAATDSSSSSSSIDALRKTFRDAMATKEQEIENLKLQLQQNQKHSPEDHAEDAAEAQQEIQDLHEENQYLRQEFDRLKTRYEAVLKTNRAAK